MNNEYIGVIDSGVGGLSVLKELVISMPNENYVYYGDNQNAPYGEKSDRRLLELLFNDISMFNGFKLKALIVGCNTLSVCVLKYLRKSFDFEIFGVYPPTLTPLIKGYKTLLLSTPRTAQNTSVLRGLTVKPLSNLAMDVEQNLDDLGEINIYDHLGNIKGDFDAVILGCTHYDLIKNQIFSIILNILEIIFIRFERKFLSSATNNGVA